MSSQHPKPDEKKPTEKLGVLGVIALLICLSCTATVAYKGGRENADTEVIKAMREQHDKVMAFAKEQELELKKRQDDFMAAQNAWQQKIIDVAVITTKEKYFHAAQSLPGYGWGAVLRICDPASADDYCIRLVIAPSNDN